MDKYSVILSFTVLFIIIVAMTLLVVRKDSSKEPFQLTPATACITGEGFVGGYMESLPGPVGDKNISGEPMLNNTNNYDKVTRQMRIGFPEFSWKMNGTGERVFRMLSTDVSRIGYDNTGRVYNFICPTFGTPTPLGPLHIEVTVAGVRAFLTDR